MMNLTKLRAVFNPEMYQGWGKTKNYFEGWYFKMVSHDESIALAVIPGVAMDENANRHSFVQVLDGKKRTAFYHKFSFDDFSADKNFFKISIAGNLFSTNGMILDLPGLKGELKFENSINWPKHLYSPGIMGPYTFVPFMECYHGIVSMDHSLSGQLKLEEDWIDFENGRGYIEKDWGHSFPEAYVWLQSNHFSTPGISIKASVAKIPWIQNSFVGFIAGVWVDNKLCRFTTYNLSKLVSSKIESQKVELVFVNREYRLEILAKRNEATELASPICGFMDGRIEESMTSQVEVNLFDLKGKKSVLSDLGRNAGLEVAGKIEEIII